MEQALLRAGLRAGLKRSTLLQHNPIVQKHAFDTAIKMMATVHQRGNKYLFAVKGAPEAVLAAADRTIADDGEVGLDGAARAAWQANVEYLGQRGLRVLACAIKTGTQTDVPPYENLTFIGLDRSGRPGARRCAARYQGLQGRWHPRGHGHGRSRGDRAQHRPRRRAGRSSRPCDRRTPSRAGREPQ